MSRGAVNCKRQRTDGLAQVGLNRFTFLFGVWGRFPFYFVLWYTVDCRICFRHAFVVRYSIRPWGKGGDVFVLYLLGGFDR